MYNGFQMFCTLWQSAICRLSAVELVKHARLLIRPCFPNTAVHHSITAPTCWPLPAESFIRWTVVCRWRRLLWTLSCLFLMFFSYCSLPTASTCAATLCKVCVVLIPFHCTVVTAAHCGCRCTCSSHQAAVAQIVLLAKARLAGASHHLAHGLEQHSTHDFLVLVF
jgi:hypothetical protein